MSFGKTRQESAELILAEWCWSIGLPLSRNQKLSTRVCRPYGPKILNATELCNLIEKTVSAKAEKDLNREAGCERSNQTSEASYDCHAGMKPRKIPLNDSEQITVGKASSRKALISENFSRPNPSNSQSKKFDQQ